MSVNMSPNIQPTAGKPHEVEGFFDRNFYTPLGGWVAGGLRRTALTPNHVSWLSVAAAAAAAAAYLVPSLTGALAASGLFLASGVLDSADGQLARATGRTSELGETLDGFCDTLSFGLVYLAAAIIFVVRDGGSPTLIVALMLLAGLSHSIQSSLVDFERQLFIHFVTGRGRVLREDPEILRRDRHAARALGEGRWPQALRAMRLAYCGRQRRWLSSSVALLDLHRRCVEPFPDRHRRFAALYRSRMSGTLKLWTLLAPNSHTFGVLACGLAPFLVPASLMPGLSALRWGLPLVFAFDLALNLPLAVLIPLQRRTDRVLAGEIEALGGEQAPLRGTRVAG
ncbi:MAG: CDP-alcohol phosphatidyltransferase [Alphaproteobacteria bacterium]|nr:CDP-alcohol phosphatidyltransferase [Alphaproteobacteria bacterium]